MKINIVEVGLSNFRGKHCFCGVWQTISPPRAPTHATPLQEMPFFAHLCVHEAEGKTHGDAQQPHEHNFEDDTFTSFVATEFHRVFQAQVTVHADCTQMHD